MGGNRPKHKLGWPKIKKMMKKGHPHRQNQKGCIQCSSKISINIADPNTGVMTAKCLNISEQ